MIEDHAGGESAVVYVYRPSALGAPREFKLTEDAIEWAAGRASGRIPFRDIRRLRMSVKPASMLWHRFLTEVWAEGAPKLAIVSTSWKSMIEQERLDKPYAAFVAELHRRIALAAPPTRFEQGRHPLLFWPSLIAFAGVAVGMAILVVRALQADAKGGAAFIGAFLLFFLWQGGNFFRRNRPGLYRPEAPPAELMPKG